MGSIADWRLVPDSLNSFGAWQPSAKLACFQADTITVPKEQKVRGAPDVLSNLLHHLVLFFFLPLIVLPLIFFLLQISPNLYKTVCLSFGISQQILALLYPNG